MRRGFVVLLLVACRPKPAPIVDAGSAAAPTVATAPRDAVAPPSPDWKTPIEDLVLRHGIERLAQTESHVVWTDPPTLHAINAKSTLLAIAKAAPKSVITVAEDIPAEQLVTSESHAFLIDGISRGFIIDPNAKTTTAIALPPETSADAFEAMAAGSGATLYFASFNGVTSWKLWTVSAKAPARVFATSKGTIGRLVGTPSGVLLTEQPTESSYEIVNLRAPPKARTEWTKVARPTHVDALAPVGSTLVWSDFEVGESKGRPIAIHVLVPNAPPRVLATKQSPRQLEANRTRACWATYRSVPAPDATTSVWCTPLAGGPHERAIGPLEQTWVSFVLDERHLYWAEETGGKWKLRRRPLP